MSANIVTFQDYLDSITEYTRPLAEEVNSALMQIQPEYTCKYAWGSWAYRYGTNHSCMITDYEDHIKLMIMRGAKFNDPDGILAGKGENTRHVRFDSLKDIDQKQLADIMHQQFALFDSGVKAEAEPNSRKRIAMPDFVRGALKERGLTKDYEARPPYQQNDYLSWITGAKQEQTKQRRLHQMLDELEQGGIYMNMPHPASEKS